MGAGRWRLVGAAAAAAALMVPGRAASAALRLPPVDFPDPDVIAVGGTYWAYATGSHGLNLQVISSDQLLAGASPTEALPVLPTWAVRGMTWAPGVVQLRNGFAMYYTVHDAGSGDECISMATSPQPGGPFVDRSTAPMLCQVSDGGSIDARPFVAPDGRMFLLWKSNDNSEGFGPTIWSEALTPDGTGLVGSPVRLVSDTSAWQFPVIERPAMTAIDGGYYLFYAANHYFTAQSGIGYAVCTTPLGPCTDETPDAAFLGTHGAVVGPSGPSPFRSPAGVPLLGFVAWSGGPGYANGGVRSLWVGTLSFPPAYRAVTRDGGVLTFGTATFLGAASASHPVAPIIGMAVTPDGGGYWQAAADGGVFAFGTATFDGSAGGLRLAAPVVAIMAGPTGGYALVGHDGGVFAFGGFGFAGSDAGHPGAPIVGAAATAFGRGSGYWLARADGTVDAFGSAPALGSQRAGAPAVAIAADPSGIGYWVAAADGTVSAFGSAHPYGSLGGAHAPVVGLVPTPTGSGYWVFTADGGVFTFGDAPFAGAPARPGVTAAAGAPATLHCAC